MHKQISALIVGYGAMGQAVEKQLLGRGHKVSGRIDSKSSLDASLTGAEYDVAIEFSTPAAAETNVRKLIEAHRPVVCGTTGWEPSRLADLAEEVHVPFLHAANFSIGVAVMKRLAAAATEVLRSFPEFEPAMIERHHNRKRDAPSGTAKLLGEVVREAGDYPHLQITALRQGGIAGEHTLFFEGEAETIELTHRAHSRDIFAIGAVRAAEWLVQERPSGLVNFDTFLERNTSWNAPV